MNIFVAIVMNVAILLQYLKKRVKFAVLSSLYLNQNYHNTKLLNEYTYFRGNDQLCKGINDTKFDQFVFKLNFAKEYIKL